METAMKTDATKDNPENDNLKSLAQKQWTDLFLKAGLGDENRIKQIAGATAKLDLRHALALSNLGRFWDDFIRSNSKSDAPNAPPLSTIFFPFFFPPFS